MSTEFLFKHDALIFKKTLPHATLYFHWFEDAFARLNASVEPPQTHAELCRQRAQELRNTYSYLRLWFSGGADSQTALDSFVNNNIHLDEIILTTFPDNINSATPASTSDREIAIAAIPALQQIKQKLALTKITILLPTASDVGEWFNGATDPDKISGFDTVDGNLAFSMDLGWALGTKLKDPGPVDFCDIIGGSKVKLWKNKNKWYFYFIDTSIHDAMFSSRTEDFFVSRNIPELYLKTVYMLRQFHINLNSTDLFVKDLPNTTALGKIYNAAMGRSSVHDIAAYKLYRDTYNQASWDKHLISGWSSTNFYKNVINSAEGQQWHKNYKTSMTAMIQEHSDEWNTDQFGNAVAVFGRKGHLSKFYCLNDSKTYTSQDAGWTDQ
ncbi:hypothetical protein [Haliscomenobacter sp.]|uniref:hypothetical protein n=1 Tax=Haliscomenobacter sp. TaxID=2717303 RepID=UPI0033652ECF